LIAGRKLLLADDSAAVQKVIELTFADEGMEVFSVGDGRAAWEKLEHFTPDVILADAFMTGLSGYELCRSVKHDNRFSQIPVMLLVSSFAPFDEAEAQRVGADDIMTKPFQSIRQLVSRVDSLISGQRSTPTASPDQPLPEPAAVNEVVSTPVEAEESEPQVTVLVEAAQMETAPAPAEPAGACAPDIEFQTADTARLESAESKIYADASEDTIEIEPQFEHDHQYVGLSQAESLGVNDQAPMFEVTPHEPIQPRFSESVLDLDEAQFAPPSAMGEDLILDLDLEEPASAAHGNHSFDSAPAPAPEPVTYGSVSAGAPEISQAMLSEPSPVAEAASVVSSAPAAHALSPELDQGVMSPAVIDAIARRVIEQMSDKVVREIAWEVVPELSELMIRKKLDQQ